MKTAKKQIKPIALIAHDGKKAEMVAFLKDHIDILKHAKLIATGTTGKHVKHAGLKVTTKLSGPLGGDAEIAALAARKKLAAIIFFRDPLGKHPHEPDIQMLLRLADLHNIPLATNPATAFYMLRALMGA